jgi:hypothetical protein
MSYFSRTAFAAALSIALVAPVVLTSPALAAETPVAAEKNPPGDIPDSQVFITYAGPGFSMQVPEGWSRQDENGGALFSDKYNLIEVASSDVAVAPTIDSVTTKDLAEMTAGGRAVEVSKVSAVELAGGHAIRIDYSSNSEPNPVTDKQVRLERVRYLFFKSGRLVTLDMAAPFGADNVDQWLLMADSVRIP